jgi:transporter family protein
MNTIVYALIAFFAWGIGITCEAIAARRIDSKSFTLWGFILGFIISSLYIPFALPDLTNITPSLFVLCVVIGFLIIIGSLFYYEALKIGNPPLVGTIGSSFPLVTVMISVLLLKESVTVSEICIILCIFFGLILSLIDVDALKKRKIILNKGVALALVTMICWGTYSSLIKIPIQTIGWFWPNWIFLSTFPLLYAYMKLTKSPLQLPKNRSVILPVVATVLLVRGAEYAYNAGLRIGNASVVAPIAGANPILFVLLAHMVFKEPLRKSQIIGMTITLLGIVLLAIVGSS